MLWVSVIYLTHCSQKQDYSSTEHKAPCKCPEHPDLVLAD